MMNAFTSEDLNPRAGGDDFGGRRLVVKGGDLKTSYTCPSGARMLRFCMWLVPTALHERTLVLLSPPGLDVFPPFFRMNVAFQSGRIGGGHLIRVTLDILAAAPDPPSLRPPWCTAEWRVSRFKFVLHLAGRPRLDAETRGPRRGWSTTGRDGGGKTH